VVISSIAIRSTVPSGNRAIARVEEGGLGDKTGWADFRSRCVSPRLQRDFPRSIKRLVQFVEDFRGRLHGGKLSKARKGELLFALPVGFNFDDDKITFDADQEVQTPFKQSLSCSNERAPPTAWSSASRNSASASASVVRRRLGRKTAPGPPDPLEGARYPGQSVVRRPLRVRTTSIVQADWAKRRDPHSVPKDEWVVTGSYGDRALTVICSAHSDNKKISALSP
jgi:hypothetical protein